MSTKLLTLIKCKINQTFDSLINSFTFISTKWQQVNR